MHDECRSWARVWFATLLDQAAPGPVGPLLLHDWRSEPLARTAVEERLRDLRRPVANGVPKHGCYAVVYERSWDGRDAVWMEAAEYSYGMFGARLVLAQPIRRGEQGQRSAAGEPVELEHGRLAGAPAPAPSALSSVSAGLTRLRELPERINRPTAPVPAPSEAVAGRTAVWGSAARSASHELAGTLSRRAGQLGDEARQLWARLPAVVATVRTRTVAVLAFLGLFGAAVFARLRELSARIRDARASRQAARPASATTRGATTHGAAATTVGATTDSDATTTGTTVTDTARPSTATARTAATARAAATARTAATARAAAAATIAATAGTASAATATAATAAVVAQRVRLQALGAARGVASAWRANRQRTTPVTGRWRVLARLAQPTALVSVAWTVVLLVGLVSAISLTGNDDAAARGRAVEPVMAAAAPPAAVPGDPVRDRAAPNRRGGADLGLTVPISRPSCNGGYGVFVGASVRPGAYQREVGELLARHSGASYLLAEQACSSLRSRTGAGRSIYAVYYGPFTSLGSACATKSRLGGGSYVRRLDESRTGNVAC